MFLLFRFNLFKNVSKECENWTEILSVKSKKVKVLTKLNVN